MKIRHQIGFASTAGLLAAFAVSSLPASTLVTRPESTVHSHAAAAAPSTIDPVQLAGR